MIDDSGEQFIAQCVPLFVFCIIGLFFWSLSRNDGRIAELERRLKVDEDLINVMYEKGLITHYQKLNLQKQ